MTRPTAGSLCSGYLGLELALETVLGPLDLRWVSDNDKGATKILAHHHPDVPNLGDFTVLDWPDVEPVDVLTAGFPCQDVSHAGKRAGLRPGTRTGIWSHIAEAVEVMRPALCVFENVRGLLSAEAHSDVEPCPWCVGDEPEGSLRALGAVLGDLAERGYDCRVTGVRAADVGAPHGRFRVFVVAEPADADRDGQQGQRRLRAVGHNAHGRDRAREAPALLPTPRASDPAGEMSRSSDGFRPQLGEAVRMLPTPTTEPTTGNGHARNLGAEARLLPTPEASRAGGTPERHLERKLEADGHARTSVTNLDVLAAGASTRWGDYAAAINRWEHILGRTAPDPVEPGPKGTPRLSPRFVEWMMGLPAGWVTDVPHLTRNEQLKALGNGVVPQQAAAAVAWLLQTAEAAA